MKAKAKATAKADGGTAGLAREDWDFESCPPGRELDCWLYEYARESEDIVREYRQCKEHPCAGYAVDPSFDENGNWSRTIDILDENGDLDEQIRVELAPGFPEVPYLKTKHVPVQYDGEDLDIESFTAPAVRDAGKMENYVPRPAAHYFAHLYIRWEAADKKLLRAFARWLKEHRPFPPKTSRGRSAARANMADLRALGAHRLMRVMTVPEAIEFTARQRRGNPLFAAVPDWYRAKRRAQKVINRYFWQ